MDPQPERRLVAGRYRLLSPLGAGGMGTVWRAEDEVLGRAVAVKEVLFPHGLSDEDRDVLRERTRREARAAARLDHPSAVTVFDVVEEDGAPFLVMELVEAATLSHVVRTDGPLTPQRTAEVGLALLGALEAAHRQGIVHRDVKPGNVLLGPSGRVVLTDFGIASSPGDSAITSTGLLLGSPAYIAPERARGESPGPASDLWSLGATLFTAVEGRPPYDGGDPLTTVTAVVTGEHAPFVHAGPLQQVIEGLLAREPASRYGVVQAQRELAKVAATASPHAPTPAPSQEPTRPEPERTTALDVEEVREATTDEPTAAHALLPLDGPRDAAAPVAGATVPAPAPEAPATAALPLPDAAPVPAALPVPDAAPVPAALPVPDAAPAAPPSRPAVPDAVVAEQPYPPPPRRSRLPLVLAGLVLLGALAFAASLLLGGSPNPLTALGGDEPSASAPPSNGPAALPAGWTRFEEPDEGWSIGVPPGYERTTYRGTQVQLREQATRRTLRIDFSDDPGPSALQAWEAFSTQLATRLGDYEELRVEEVEFQGLDAADLEFTYFDETTLHVLDRTAVSEDGTHGIALYWQVPESRWQDSLPVFEQIAATFSFG